ncbi:hypothetical protein FRB90_008398 [Tulasnella sp. 427]|nr:hypothetical protein FRB90_008398 [Tulasnella sp. 427]
MEEAVRSLLPLTPNITKLSLRNYSSSVNDSSEPDYRVGLLLEVDRDSSAPRFCKRLEELDLSGGDVPDELLAELMEFRKSTLKRIIRENPGMAHVEELPFEVLSTIFALLFGILKEQHKHPADSYAFELLQVLLVCTRWNSVASKTPSLWTLAHVGTDQGSVARASRTVARSGNLPLDINFQSLRDDVSDFDCAVATLKVLSPHASRWRSLSLPCFVPTLVESISSLGLPNLVDLVLVPRSARDASAEYSYNVIRIRAPNLQTLLSQCPSGVFFGLKRPRLKSLEAREVSGSDYWLWVLFGAGQDTLQELVIRAEGRRLSLAEHSPFVDHNGKETSHKRLSALRTLEVAGGSFLDWRCIWFAEMPSLKHLIIEVGAFPDVNAEADSLPPFETLESISITKKTSFSMRAAVRFLLARTPNITKLSLKDYSLPVDDGGKPDWRVSVLLEEELDSSTPLFCKRLEELDLSGGGIPRSVLGELMDFREPVIKRVLGLNPGPKPSSS